MDKTDVIILVTALIASLPGLLAFIIRLRGDKLDRARAKVETRSAEVEMADKLIDAAAVLLDPLKERIIDLEDRLYEVTKLLNYEVAQRKEMQAQLLKVSKINLALCEGVKVLIRQLGNRGIVPEFIMPAGACEEMSDFVESIEKNGDGT